MLLKALTDSGLKVPDDIAIFGFDGIELCEFVTPPLSTVKVHTEEMGKVAVNLLVERIDGRTLPLKVVVPTSLIIRKSCGGEEFKKILRRMKAILKVRSKDCFTKDKIDLQKMIGGFMLKKRISLLLILAISFAMLLSACGNSEKSSSQGKSGEKVLRFATWDTGESLKYQQDIAKKFEKANPGVKVQVEAYADGFEDKLAASFGAKNPPDVMYMWNYPDYYKSLEPLDDYVNKDSSFKTTFDDFYTNILNYHKFKNTTYGFPIGFTTRVIYYNKKLFQEAGVPLPTSGWTGAVQ